MALYISGIEKEKPDDQFKKDTNNAVVVGTWPMKTGKVDLRIASPWHDAILMDENEAKITVNGRKREGKLTTKSERIERETKEERH